jgi:hypothetical protein
MVAKAITPKVEAQIAKISSDDETLTAITSDKSPDDPLIDNIYNYNYSVHLANMAYNPTIQMYDWLADTGLTHHISN